MKCLLLAATLLFPMYSAYGWTELTGNIRGIVTNQESGQVVRGATLRLIPFSGGEPSDIEKTYSQDEGEYIFANVPPGIYNVECTAFGYKTTRLVGLQIREDRTKLAYFKLNRGPAAEVLEIYTYASMEAQQQMKTSTTTAIEEIVGTAPATVYTFEAQDIEARGYNSLNELLLDVPEFQIQQHYSGETANLVSARGIAGNEKLLILINGHRYNSMSSVSYSILENYNIRYAKRVEIIIGPASALYGADAYMGVVNITTKKGSEVKGVGISAEYGQFNTTQTSFEGGLGNEKVSFGIQGSYFQTDGPNLPELYPNDFNWFNNIYSRTGQVLTSPVDPISTTTLPIRPFYLGRRAFHGGLYFDYKDFSASLNVNHEAHSSSLGTRPEYSPYWEFSLLGANFINLTAEQRYFRKHKKLSAKTELNVSVHALTAQSKFENTFSGYQEAYKASTDAGVRLTQTFTYAFNEQHTLTAGLYAQHGFTLPQTSDLPFSIPPVAPMVPINTVERGLYYLGTDYVDEDGNSLRIYQNFYRMRRISTGGFVEYKGTLFKRLHLTFGFRYDQIFDISEYSPQKTLRSYYSLSPRVGVVYQPINGLVAKFFVGRGFLQPAPERKYDHFGQFYPVMDNNGNYTHIEGGFWRLPNEDLLPESTNAMEVALRYAKGDFLIGANSYFNTIYNNWGLTIDTDNPSFMRVPISLAERTVNNPEPIFTYGTTITGDYRTVFGEKEQYSLRINASYSYAGGFAEGYTHVPFTPDHSAKMGILIKIHNLTWYNSLSYRTDTYGQLSIDNDGNSFQNLSPSYFLWNSFLRYQLLQKSKIQLSLFARVRNVLDNRYYNVAENSAVSLSSSPQDPLLITGGVSVHFGRIQTHR